MRSRVTKNHETKPCEGLQRLQLLGMREIEGARLKVQSFGSAALQLSLARVTFYIEPYILIYIYIHGTLYIGAPIYRAPIYSPIYSAIYKAFFIIRLYI